MGNPVSHPNLALTSLGPGDLVDRAVRFYRRNFATFIYIAGPPVVFGAVMSLLWKVAVRFLADESLGDSPDQVFVYSFLIWIGNIFIWAVELIAMFTVMGGASLNFVRHLVFGEPLSFSVTYRNVKPRFFGLIVSSLLVTTILGYFVLQSVFLGFIVGMYASLFSVALLKAVPTLAVFVGVLVGMACLSGALVLFFFLASRFICIPQAILVENLSMRAALLRSIDLGKGTAARFASLFLFTLFASYSALAILYVPLGWYSWISGYQWFEYGNATAPLWYEMSTQLVGQTSLLFSMPVVMIGLCLIYVDGRIRDEGFDIEILAARHLPEVAGGKAEMVGRKTLTVRETE